MLRTRETLIEQGTGTFGRPYALVHVKEGTVPAGAGTRFQKECFAVISQDRDGTRHGQQFKTLTEARAFFDQWTKPIIAQTA